MKSNLIEVRAARKGNGKYMYTGVTVDGQLVVLRKQATRLYQNAYFYEYPVCSGTTGLAAHFTYGKAPGQQWGNGGKIFPVETFKVIAP